MTFQALLIAHVLLTTTGYVGLIASDAVVLLLAARTDQTPQAARATLSTWRRSEQIFGPMLGLGVLLGFGVAAAMHVPLASGWLVATYVLIVLALAVQVAVAIPWEVRSSAALARGEMPSFGPVRVAAIGLAAIYTAIVVMMVARPF